MSAVTPFLFESEHMVRVVIRDGEPWFVAKDVATLLGYANTRKAVSDHCKCGRPVGGNDSLPPGLDPQTVIIPERDLYRLIMRSKLPTAEKFEEWVVGDVLPAIRKTGAYGQPRRGADLAAQRHALTLIDRLKRETSPTVRAALHAMLTETMGGMDIAAPPLDALGRESPPPPDVLEVFWRDVADIQANGGVVNHARDAGLLAVRLPELRGRLTLPVTTALRQALKQSTAPRFVAVKAVNSAVTGKAVKCWVFAVV